MLPTITSTHPPATDLGHLLHKNPTRCHSFELPKAAPGHVLHDGRDYGPGEHGGGDPLVGGDLRPRRRGDSGRAPGLRGQGKARIGAARLKMSGQGVRADHLRLPETWSGSGPGA
jgi:hypothetical protein